jgi:UDP-N-acetyl-D-mannosaminuronic acid dehydrogenase
MKRISIVGLGYIGLPTAIQAAQTGYDVYGFDINHDKVKRINSGDPIIFEPELSDRLWKTLKAGTFKAFTDLQYADCFIIAVPTPFKENKKADLRHVFLAGEAIAKRLMPGNLVILESTVPVGTTEKLALFLEENSGLKLGIDFFIAYCPERVLPGKIFKELVENDRTIGGICQRSCDLAYQFYSKFVKGFIHITDDKTAEMVKLVENTSRDVQIAFANQVAAMCTRAGIDPYHVIDLANKHPRVKILTPSCGVGGHCIAVDPWFLVETFPEDTALLRTAREINDNKPFTIINRVLHKVEELRTLGIAKPKILTLGLSFKPDVDDIRESPALLIAQQLSQKKDLLDLQAYDHNVNKDEIIKHNLDLITDVWQGIAWADIILILVKHKEFTLMREDAFGNKVIIDTCGLLHDIQIKQTHAILEGATKTQSDFWN